MDAGLCPAALKHCFPFPSSSTPNPTPCRRILPSRPSILVASGASRDADPCLLAPLEPRSPAGKLLNRVLLDDRKSLPLAAGKELSRIALRREDAASMKTGLSLTSADEAFLYRRIAQMKEEECRIEVEDVIYALILHKFVEMRVHLVPRLSQCLCNNRLEIWPRHDWELESIHSIEVLEMVREHVNSTPGYRADCSIRESWSTTQIQRAHLRNLYNASIFYGYFLKSASVRHTLESNLITKASYHHLLPLLSNCIGLLGGGDKATSLKGYVMGLKQETMEVCGRVRSREAVDVVGRHCCALFGESNKDCGVVATSFASVKRLLLEAVAFGCFLWDAETCVDSVYPLEDSIPLSS